jgi:hypothetical protein
VSLSSKHWVKETFKCLQELISDLDPCNSVAEFDKLREEIPGDLERALKLIPADNNLKILAIKSPPHEYDTEPEKDDLDNLIADLSFKLISRCPKLRILELDLYSVQISRLIDALNASGARPEKISVRSVQGVDLVELVALSDLYPDIRQLNLDCWLPPGGDVSVLIEKAKSGAFFPHVTSLTFPATVPKWDQIWKNHSAVQEMAVIWADTEEDPTGILASAEVSMHSALQSCIQMTPPSIGTNLVFIHGQRPRLTADTLLTDAVRTGDEAGVLTILSQGVDVNRRFSAFEAALPPAIHEAILSGHLSMVNLLVDAGAVLTLRSNGCTALFHAMQTSDPDIRSKIFTAETLLQCCGGAQISSTLVDSFLRSAETYVHALGDEQWFDAIGEEEARLTLQWALSEPRHSWFGLSKSDPTFSDCFIDYELFTPAHRSQSNISFALYELGVNARKVNIFGQTPIETNTHDGAVLMLIMWYIANCQVGDAADTSGVQNLVSGTPEYAALLHSCAALVSRGSSDLSDYLETLINNGQISDLTQARTLHQLWLGSCWSEIVLIGETIAQRLTGEPTEEDRALVAAYLHVAMSNLGEEADTMARAFHSAVGAHMDLLQVGNVFMTVASLAGLDPLSADFLDSRTSSILAELLRTLIIDEIPYSLIC